MKRRREKTRAHLSDAVLGGNHADSHAPWFHSRSSGGGAATRLDPR
ncbi:MULTISPECIES: hypothetical protein [unclassified Rathayibacter]|jgi:hypothetical protein|nr:MULTISPECIES: hypothetical protein [unclassified Rathayibacter]